MLANDSFQSDAISSDRLYNSLILIVDDIEVNRRVLMHNLQARGYTNMITAADGAQALEMTHAHKPDLVILDLMMPGMDGFAYCQAVRHDSAYDQMPIIVQTALDAVQDKVRAFKLGASDYICKPVDPGELSARAQVHLVYKLQMEDLRAYRRRINSELDAARQMQARLMPEPQQMEMCEFMFNMKIAASFETSSALGGDCWGMFPLSPSRLAVYMYDFSGHGMTAALNVFRMHTLMQDFMSVSADPGNFLATLNRHLHPLLGSNEFATMFYGIIDTEANCLLYATAASPPPLLFTKTAHTPLSLNGRGFPLGVVATAAFETKYTPFVEGDLLLLYSDCLIETTNNLGDYLNEQQIKDAMLNAFDKQPENPSECGINNLKELFYNHNPAPIKDDMTMNAYFRAPKR